jgi:hypothetical protein
VIASLAALACGGPEPAGPRSQAAAAVAESPASELASAPSRVALGVTVGVASLAAVEATLRERGLTCEDTSVRASVEKLREHKREQLANDPDAVSGASILERRSKKEDNPQIRLACSVDSLAQIEAGRAQVAGRALFVFDGPEQPLRHASLRRNYQVGQQAGQQVEAALLDLRETVARFEATYGEPSLRRGTIPEPGDAPAKLEPIRVQWRYADLFIEVAATHVGALVSVDERVELPWR